MSPPAHKEKLIKAALTLASQKDWKDIVLADIAKEAKMQLVDVCDYFEDKTDIIAAYGRTVDKQVLNKVDPSTLVGMSVKERLFDILMERFDIINENRSAVVSILKSFCLDPKQMVISLPHIGRSMAWMLEAAHVDTNGIKGAVKVAGLVTIYAAILRTWKNDETKDLSKTMAALDKALGRADRAVHYFQGYL